MPTLKEFEEALREHGMQMALAILQRLRERDRATRTIARARRVTGRKMTPELAHRILALHASTGMTQQEIAFELGVNQGRVNEVIKRGKWLSADPGAPEAVARDKALARMRKTTSSTKRIVAKPSGDQKRAPSSRSKTRAKSSQDRQLTFADL